MAATAIFSYHESVDKQILREDHCVVINKLSSAIARIYFAEIVVGRDGKSGPGKQIDVPKGYLLMSEQDWVMPHNREFLIAWVSCYTLSCGTWVLYIEPQKGHVLRLQK